MASPIQRSRSFSDSSKELTPKRITVKAGEELIVITPMEKGYFEKASDSLSHGIGITRGLASRYLAPSFLVKTTKNSIKAKVLPLSDPPGWQEKMNAVKKSRSRLITLKKSLESDLPLAGNSVRKEGLKERLEIIKKSIQRKEALIAHYQEERDSQIRVRLGGLAGSAINVMLPGSGAGTVVSTAITGAEIRTREKSAAEKLSDEHPAESQEIRNVRCSSKVTVICSVAGLVFSYYVLPPLKQAAWQVIAGE